jgi:hypothetical protein
MLVDQIIKQILHVKKKVRKAVAHANLPFFPQSVDIQFRREIAVERTSVWS